MNKKKDTKFFWKLTEADMENTKLFISEDSRPMGRTEAEVTAMVAAWRLENDARLKKAEKSDLKVERLMNFFMIPVSVVGWWFALKVGSQAFTDIDANAAENFNTYAVMTGLLFTGLAGLNMYLFGKNLIDGIYNHKKIKELGE